MGISNGDVSRAGLKWGSGRLFRFGVAGAFPGARDGGGRCMGGPRTRKGAGGAIWGF